MVSELIMKEKLQKCSSSTGSETSEDGGVTPTTLSKRKPTGISSDVGLHNEPSTSHDNARYLPLKLPSAASNAKPECAKSTPPSPASSSSRIQPSTSSASSSSLSSESPAGSDLKHQ